MPLTPDQARQLLSQMDAGEPEPQATISPEQARQLLSQMDVGQPMQGPQMDTGAPMRQMAPQQAPPPSSDAYKQAIQQQFAQQLQQGRAADPGKMRALASGGLKGLLGFGAGLGELEAKLIDKLLGTKTAGKAPKVELPQAMQKIMEQYPTSAAVGEFAGEGAPLMALPGGELKMASKAIEGLPKYLQGIARLGGRAAKGAGVGAAVAPVYQPGVSLEQSMKEGAELGAAGVGLEGLWEGIKYSPKLAGKMLGGTKSAEEVKDFVGSLNRLGVNAPIAETIGSRGAAKFQKTVLKNIPGSGMSQEYSNISEGLKGQLEEMKNKLNPENLHAGQETQDILSSRYKGALDTVGKLYDDLQSNVLRAAPGDIHQSDNMLSESKAIRAEFDEFKKLAGGSVKIPKSVIDFIGEIEKSPKNLNSALRQDEIINEHIGDARSKASMGDREGKRELRYFNRLKSSNLKDIDRTIESIDSPEISKQWSETKDFYKQNVVPFDKKGSILGKIINPKTRADEVQSLFIKKSGQQPKAQIMKEVTDFLPQATKDKLAHNQLLGPSDENLLSMIDEYKKLQPAQRKELFRAEDKQVMDDILNVRKHIGKNEFNQMFVADTGSKVAHAIPALMYGAGAAAGGPLAGLGALAGGMAGGRAAKGAVMSDALKKLYLKSLQESKQGPQIGRAAYMGLPFLGNNGNK